jgi:ATP-dependent DNA helicase RecQ
MLFIEASYIFTPYKESPVKDIVLTTSDSRQTIMNLPIETGESGEQEVFQDPVSQAVQQLFGLSYLFPYQRLVIANILEAAEAKGFAVRWPGEIASGKTSPDKASSCGPVDSKMPSSPLPETGETEEWPEKDQDRESLGRQIVILPTGAGKSLCFQLPAMLLAGPTLVIYPILSLMADQERRLKERGFAPVILRGGQSREERDLIWKKLRSGESRFIIANPEVLLTQGVMGKLGEIGVVHVVIDEAHCVSEWGESFRPGYLEIGKILEAAKGTNRTEPLVTAFTATASAPVLEKIEKYIFGTPAHRIIGNPDRSNISYAAQGCLLRDLAVRDLLRSNRRPAIVFCSSRPGTEQLSRYLRNQLDEREIRFYHAGLNREEKAEVEGWFFQSAEGVLVSTCAYGMGVDKANIRTVIHRDCPPSVEAYLQESGRAGRDGQPSRAILLWGPDDGQAITRAKTGPDRERMAGLLAYSRDAGRCRRKALLSLLNYEGADDSPETACCDVCEGKAGTLLREEPALIGFFKKNRRCYTLKEAVRVLAASEYINWSEDEVKQAIKLLLRDKRLRMLKIPFWKDKITVPRRT